MITHSTKLALRDAALHLGEEVLIGAEVADVDGRPQAARFERLQHLQRVGLVGLGVAVAEERVVDRGAGARRGRDRRATGDARRNGSVGRATIAATHTASKAIGSSPPQPTQNRQRAMDGPVQSRCGIACHVGGRSPGETVPVART